MRQTCNIGQTGIGDPSYWTLAPVDQYLSSLTVVVPQNYQETNLSIVANRNSPVWVDGELLCDLGHRVAGSGTKLS